MRLIDADALLAAYDREHVGAPGRARKLIEEAQDAVVRCMDCKWWDRKGESRLGYCHACKHGHRSERWEIGIYRVCPEDWFCADGEIEDGV